MTTEYTIRTVLEILTAVALTVGLIFEDRVAAWEQNMLKKLRRRLFPKRNIIHLDRKRSPRDESRAIGIGGIR